MITDVLVERGNKQVVLSTAKNCRARFSQAGFCRLVKRSDGDDALAECVGSRPDIPRPLLLALLETASELVRSKLIAENPHSKPEIYHAIATVTDELRDNAHTGLANHADAQALILSLGDWANSVMPRFEHLLKNKKIGEVTAALAHMCDMLLLTSSSRQCCRINQRRYSSSPKQLSCRG